MQQLVPNEPERMDIRFASIVQAIWNVQIAKSTKKNAKPKFEPLSEFRIYFGDLEKPLPQGPTRAQSAAEQWARLKATFMGMVGKTPPADPPVTE